MKKQMRYSPEVWERADRLPDRIKRDRALEREIQRVWDSNFKVYGANKVWRQMLREGIRVARCTVERLMKKLGIQGIRRSKKCWTTIADDLTDQHNRQFLATRPNQLWVADITFVATWAGFVYVAFIICQWPTELSQYWPLKLSHFSRVTMLDLALI